MIQNNHRQILDYLLIQRVILFLAVHEYLSNLLQDAVIQTGSNSYTPDANGNMQTRNGISITYDYDNRPTSIGGTTFIYDYSGQRVKKNSTIYIGKLYECNGSSCIKYIFAGNSRVASKSSSATYYYHTDHLGSSTILTDAAGNKAQETYYYPFGEIRYNSGSATHYKFTGQEYDDETGLYYYGARYYDPVIGRFISADTVVPDPFYPQSLNRYSYALNNPVVIKDADGHFPFLALIAIGMAIGGASAAINGGNVEDILRGMIMGGVSAGMGFGVGAIAAPAGAIVSGIVGGATAGLIASGPSGKVGQGMLIGAITGGIAGGIGAIPFDDAYIEGLVQITTGTVVGGVASDLTGGSFSQGALIGGISAAATWAVKQASSTAKNGGKSVKDARIDLVVSDSFFAGPGANPYHFYTGGTWIDEGCFNADLGQGVKIYVKNVNVLGTTISIRASKPIEETQQSILLPQQERVFKFSDFGPQPLGWRFCVSTFSDAFNVVYQIWSTWVPGMPVEH